MLAPHRLTPTLSTAPLEISELTLPPPANKQAIPTSIPSTHLFDLVIIGSGPAALALVARILSLRPAALYTEDEHRHLHFLLKKNGGVSKVPKLKTKKTGRGEEKILTGKANGLEDDCPCDGQMKILVIDKLGGWLSAWDRAFKSYSIEYLRSPLFFHPSPDLDALLSFSSRTGRDSRACPTTLLSILSRNSISACEPCFRGRTSKKQASSRFRETSNSNPDSKPDLAEIANVVGKEISKHKNKKHSRSHKSIGPAVNERDRQDYFTPSTKLFRDFIDEDVIRRHGLDPDAKWRSVEDGLAHPVVSSNVEASKAVMTVKGEISNLSYGELHVEGWERLPGFCIETSSGVKIGAKAVVSAVGTGGKPAVPSVLNPPSKRPSKSGESTPSTPAWSGPGWCHASTLTLPDHKFPNTLLQTKIKGGESKTICVIGGGLTSAQIADLSLRRGFTKVILIMRGHLKVKPFDVGLEWMGRYSNLEKMRFWQEDDPELRLEMLKSARQGGSITPPYQKLLASHESAGRLQILTHTEISSASWDQEAQEWNLTFKRTLPSIKNGRNSKISPSSSESTKEGERVEETQEKVSFCVAATGAHLDFTSLPFMKEIKERHPLRVVGGLPVLTEDLQWGKELPYFMIGAASGMQIGPAAGNLGGMREAADRVARRLEELVQVEEDGSESQSEKRRVETIGKVGGSESDSESESLRDYPIRAGYSHFNFEALDCN